MSMCTRRTRSFVAGVVAAGALVAAASTGTGSPAGAATTSGEQQTYLVVYKPSASSAGAARAVARAGGSVSANYTQIGVVVATSDAPGFAATMRRTSGVQGASATTGFATRLADSEVDAADGPEVQPGAPVPGSDNLSGLQWDMEQIQAPAARAIDGGSADVVVGDIDTGLDYTHPDLAPNVDFANSASCVGGVPNTDPAAWMDDNGHGTHTAGTIAAARNGVGIVGVAPGVRIAGIKAGDADGFFYPEAVVCAFMWAGQHGIEVTNNSYFADPWLFNCRNDADQRAIWEAERRAIRYAQKQGTVVVASEGNDAIDLSHPAYDVISPDNSTPITRTVTNACAVVPVEVPGVVGVTANGNGHNGELVKSYYSSYGISTADVVAPGGDRRFQLTAAAPNGRVLSTFPSQFNCGSLGVHDGAANYCYLQGTSMAGPHVAGVAALIASHFPGITPGAIAARLGHTADHLPCPSDMSIYAAFPGAGGVPQTCTGDLEHNSFNGDGQVNALRALTD
jgi:subtilisin family serine protease